MRKSWLTSHIEITGLSCMADRSCKLLRVQTDDGILLHATEFLAGHRCMLPRVEEKMQVS
jgi:hypothetical protein